jgi:PilZ domain-containing protein
MYRKLQVIESSVQRRRAGKRIPCDLAKVRITAEGDLTTVEGRVVDVSKSGLRLRVHKDFGRHFKHGPKVVVEMDGLLIRGRIRWCSAQKTNREALEIGLQIEEAENYAGTGTRNAPVQVA